VSSGQELHIGVEALAQHVHVLGPTGRGKTTLLCHIYLEAARIGLGAMYAEPKGDAIEEIRRRIPDKRIDDVVLLDFGDEEYPPALNLLACASGEEDIHAEALVGIFRRLFGRYWGPRSEDILRSAFSTLLANRQPGRPAPTLADVLNLLTDPAEKARHPWCRIRWGWGSSGGNGKPCRSGSGSRRSRRSRTSCAPSSAGKRCATSSAKKTPLISSGSSASASWCSSPSHRGRSVMRPTWSDRC
jgi:hypothetical protein